MRFFSAAFNRKHRRVRGLLLFAQTRFDRERERESTSACTVLQAIKVRLELPDVPSLDLLDLPGLKVAAGPGDDPNLPSMALHLNELLIDQCREVRRILCHYTSPPMHTRAYCKCCYALINMAPGSAGNIHGGDA